MAEQAETHRTGLSLPERRRHRDRRLHDPLPVPPHARVRYVDRLSKADLFSHYHELLGHDLVEPDIIADGETLTGIPDASQDFVIANHFIEHTEDPIRTLKTFLRILRKDGIIYMAVPEKNFSFDKDRKITTFGHLVVDHEEGTQASRAEHFIDVVPSARNAPKNGYSSGQRN